MKIYKTQEEVKRDIVNGVLMVNEDVKFECSISISASIKVTGDINAWDINARNINARDINAGDILYYAFCCVYKSILCTSIKARREVHSEPICLDGELTFKEVNENAKKKEVILKKIEELRAEAEKLS